MSRFASPIAALVVAFSVAPAACGGGDSSLPDPGPSSGVTTSTRIVDLTEPEAAALCDWVAGKFGGYGHGVACADGMMLSARQTRELCMMDYRSASPTCPVTVAEIEQCTNEGVGPPVCSTVPAVCFAIVPCIISAAAAAASGG